LAIPIDQGVEGRKKTLIEGFSGRIPSRWGPGASKITAPENAERVEGLLSTEHQVGKGRPGGIGVLP